MDIVNMTIAAGGLIVSFLAYLLGRRQLNPVRHELQVSVDDPISLIPSEHAGMSLIEVHSSGTVLAEPYITTLHIELLGARDVGRELFENNESITFDVPIGAVLMEAFPSTVAVALSDRKLSIGPSLLKIGEEVRVSLLTSGKPSLALPVIPIADVRGISGEDVRRKRQRRSSVVAFATLAASFILMAAGVWGVTYESNLNPIVAVSPSINFTSPWIYLYGLGVLLLAPNAARRFTRLRRPSGPRL